MDIIEALVKKLVEDEDLIKGVTPRKIQKMLDHLRNAKNTKLSPEQRQRALDQVRILASEGKEKRSAQEKASNLDKLLARSKEKTASAADKKLADIAARAGLTGPKKEKVKEAPATPGSEATRTELETSARRAKRDPKAMSDDYYDIPTIDDATTSLLETGKPEKAKRMLTAKYKSQANEALDQVGKLHGAGDIDSAHELYSAIPSNLLPKHLQNYHPDYMHYGVTPTHWGALPPEAHQHMASTHKQVLSGELDNHPDYAHIAPKVKALRNPKPTA